MTSAENSGVFRRSDGARTSVRNDLTDLAPLVIVDGHFPDDVPVDAGAARCDIEDYDPRSLVGTTGLVIRRATEPAFGTWDRLEAWPA